MNENEMIFVRNKKFRDPTERSESLEKRFLCTARLGASTQRRLRCSNGRAQLLKFIERTRGAEPPTHGPNESRSKRAGAGSQNARERCGASNARAQRVAVKNGRVQARSKARAHRAARPKRSGAGRAADRGMTERTQRIHKEKGGGKIVLLDDPSASSR